jgi:predicted nucleic acid-binding protein
MNAVFLDTVGILALLERSDQWHEAAARTWAVLLHAGRPLRTTTHVLVECANASARKPHR